MIAICRNNRHLHNDRFERFFEPTLPLPFAVGGCACLNKITGENTEFRFRHCLRYCSGAPAGMIHIFLVLNMTIGHIDEREIALFGILSAELRNVTPVVLITHTPRIICACAEVFRQCFMAYISELGIRRQFGGFTNTRARNSISQSLRCCRLRRNSDDTFDGRKIFGRGVRFGQ